MEWPEGRLGMQERSANRHAAPLPTEACNLWTQELHANRIKALTARPETDDARRFAPVGVEFGMAEEHGRSAGFVQGLPPARDRRAQLGQPTPTRAAPGALRVRPVGNR